MTRRSLRQGWLALFFVVVVLASGTGWAQYYEVFNASNTTLTFETMDPARGTWMSHSIYPHESRRYQWKSGDRGRVRIATQNQGYVEYDVYEGNQYRFIWDNNKRMWDMRTARRAANAPPPAQPQQAIWSLLNRTNETLQFETREPADTTWRAQSVFPNENKRFHFSTGVTRGKIRIATRERGFVEYDIRAGWRYSIVWDKAKGVWDFRTVYRAE
jgi:hypothetical protein